jgi:hypothetical protein
MRNWTFGVLLAGLLGGLGAFSPADAGLIGPIFVNVGVPTVVGPVVVGVTVFVRLAQDPESVDTSGNPGTFENDFYIPGDNPAGKPSLSGAPPVNGGVAVSFPTGTGVPVSTPTSQYHPGFTLNSDPAPLGPVVLNADPTDTQITFSGSPTPVHYPIPALDVATVNNGGTIEYLEVFLEATAGGLTTDIHYQVPINVGALFTITPINLDPFNPIMTLALAGYYTSPTPIPPVNQNVVDQPFSLFTNSIPGSPNGVILTFVPEPSSAALLPVGVLTALGLWWRRRSWSLGSRDGAVGTG